MKGILQFLRTTLAGGILFMVPIIVLLIVLSKALAITRKLVDPLAERLPFESVIGLKTPLLLAISVLVLFCFLAGFFARTTIAQKITTRLEAGLLSNVPGYAFLKSMAGSQLGMESEPALKVMLARIEDGWQLVFLVERLEGGHVAVFVPGAPDPQSGSVCFMSEDRIRPTDIPLAAAVKILRRLGAGSNTLLNGMCLSADPANKP